MVLLVVSEQLITVDEVVVNQMGVEKMRSRRKGILQMPLIYILQKTFILVTNKQYIINRINVM